MQGGHISITLFLHKHFPRGCNKNLQDLSSEPPSRAHKHRTMKHDHLSLPSQLTNPRGQSPFCLCLFCGNAQLSCVHPPLHAISENHLSTTFPLFLQLSFSLVLCLLPLKAKSLGGRKGPWSERQRDEGHLISNQA